MQKLVTKIIVVIVQGFIQKTISNLLWNKLNIKDFSNEYQKGHYKMYMQKFCESPNGVSRTRAQSRRVFSSSVHGFKAATDE